MDFRCMLIDYWERNGYRGTNGASSGKIRKKWYPVDYRNRLARRKRRRGSDSETGSSGCIMQRCELNGIKKVIGV